MGCPGVGLQVDVGVPVAALAVAFGRLGVEQGELGVATSAISGFRNRPSPFPVIQAAYHRYARICEGSPEPPLHHL